MRSQNGQALLIVVLIMVVSLTVGLSVASRSITNLRISTEEQSSQAAFSAAEAGIERVLKSTTECSQSNPCTYSLTDDSRSQYVAVGTSISGREFLLNGGNPIAKDDGTDIWLSDYPNYTNPKRPSSFSIYWGLPGESCPNTAAIEIIALGGSRANPITKRFGYDSCSSRSILASNNFSMPSGATRTIAGKKLQYKTPNNFLDFPVDTDILLIRVVPLYKSTPIGVYTCDDLGNNCIDLPVQGKQVESTGTSGSTARKVAFFQGHPKLPSEFFQYIIFSSLP